jgi:uncharacterized membrane protein
MKWYSSAAKTTGKGIIRFLIPTIILFVIFEKAIVIAQIIIHPIKAELPDVDIYGFVFFSLLSLLIILLVCNLAGRISESKWAKSFYCFMEKNLYEYIPGYTMIKSMASETVKDTSDGNWKVVVINEDGDLIYGIEVDKRPDGYSMVFFPAPPDAKTGRIKLIQESKFRRIDFSANKLIKIIRNYGSGSIDIPK